MFLIIIDFFKVLHSVENLQKTVVATEALVDISEVVGLHFVEKSIQLVLWWLLLVLNFDILFPVESAIDEFV